MPDTDPSPDEWTTAVFGAVTGDMTVERFNGTGAQTDFTLSTAPGSENNIQIYVSGVYIQKDAYSVSGTTLSFSSAPASGIDNIEVVIGTSVSIGTPADNTVSTSKIEDAAVTKSKIVTGVIIPTGGVIAWVTGMAPSGFLECDGSAVSRTTYADLFAVISDDYGNGDGSTTFNLPDYRGEFLRGFDNSAGNDPDAGSRTDRGDGTLGDSVGTKQNDAFQGHYHDIRATNYGNYDNAYHGDQDGSWSGQNSSGGGYDYNNYLQVEEPTADGSNGVPRTASETRPTNVGVMWIIKT